MFAWYRIHKSSSLFSLYRILRFDKRFDKKDESARKGFTEPYFSPRSLLMKTLVKGVIPRIAV